MAASQIGSSSRLRGYVMQRAAVIHMTVPGSRCCCDGLMLSVSAGNRWPSVVFPDRDGAQEFDGLVKAARCRLGGAAAAVAVVGVSDGRGGL